jgi:hypothetical protein
MNLLLVKLAEGDCPGARGDGMVTRAAMPTSAETLDQR